MVTDLGGREVVHVATDLCPQIRLLCEDGLELLRRKLQQDLEALWLGLDTAPNEALPQGAALPDLQARRDAETKK